MLSHFSKIKTLINKAVEKNINKKHTYTRHQTTATFINKKREVPPQKTQQNQEPEDYQETVGNYWSVIYGSPDWKSAKVRQTVKLSYSNHPEIGNIYSSVTITR